MTPTALTSTECSEPTVRTLVRVMESADGRLIITSSDGMQRQEVIGNLMTAAVHLAQAD